MATVVIDPTVPPNSENPQNGAFRIREVAAWLLDVLGLNSSIPQTVTIPASPQFDTTTGLFLVQMVPAVQNLVVFNDSINPTTTLDVTATYFQCINLSTNTVTFISNFSGTCVVVGAQTGSQVNGRDQAAAFPSSSFYNLYFITGDSQSPGLLASLAVPLNPPTFPSGYSNASYIGTYRTDGSANLVSQYGRGSKVWYVVPASVLANGAASTNTKIDLSPQTPAIALNTILNTTFEGTADINNNIKAEIGILAAGNTFVNINSGSPNGVLTGGSLVFTVPQEAQAIYYKWVNGTAQGLNVWVAGYEVPNNAT